MQSFEQKILQNISRHNLLDTHKCVIVAVSGGADSVALLCVLVSLGYKCVVAHCNFHRFLSNVESVHMEGDGLGGCGLVVVARHEAAEGCEKGKDSFHCFSLFG